MNLKKYTCVQLTNTHIRAVVLGKDTTQVMASGERQLSAFEDGADLFHHLGLAEAIRELFNELSLSTQQKVFLSIPGNAGKGILLKSISVPAFGHANTKLQNAAIENELTQHISFPLDQAAYGWVTMNQTEDTSHLLLAWLRRGPLLSLISRLKTIGIEPVFIMPSSLVLANQLLLNEDCVQRTCGVHIDGEQIDLIIMEEGQVMGGRSFIIPHAADEVLFWRTLKQSLAGIPNPNQATLEQIFLFHHAVSDTTFLTPERMQQELGGSHCVTRESTNAWSSTLLQCALQRKGVPLNLLASILRERAQARQQRQKQWLKRAVPIAAALGLAAANFGVWNATESTRLRVGQLAQAEDNARAQQRSIKSLNDKEMALEKQISALAWSDRHFPSFADRLSQIAMLIPKSIRLTEIKTLQLPRGREKRVSFDARETLLLVGLATSQKEIDAFRIALATQEGFTGVRQIKTEQITVQGAKWLEFTLSLTSQEMTEEEGG